MYIDTKPTVDSNVVWTFFTSAPEVRLALVKVQQPVSKSHGVFIDDIVFLLNAKHGAKLAQKVAAKNIPKWKLQNNLNS